MELLTTTEYNHKGWVVLAEVFYVPWQSKHDLKNKDELLVLVRKLPEGVPMGDLKDSYPGIAADVQVQRLITQLYCIEGRFEDDILLSCVS